MTTSNFYIGPVIKDGLRKDVKPHATPEDSFETMINAYQFRGRIKRRPGYTSLDPAVATTRLTKDGVNFNETPVMGLRTRELFGLGQQDLIGFDTTFAYRYNSTTGSFEDLPSVMPVTWSGTDSDFFFTTNYAGSFWATNNVPGLNGVAIATISNASPAQVTTTVNHGFTSTQSVAIINVGGYAPLAAGTPPLNGQVFVITFTGLNTFTIPLNGALYGAAIANTGIALNSQVSILGQDGIRYYSSFSSISDGWANYNPPIDANNALAGALLIFPYRGYLVFLNTTEGNETGTQNYGNRARWTQIGTPYYSAPVPGVPNLQTIDPKTARDDLFGRGGANDAPTQEVIIGAAFIRDVLVVYFERSTWRLRFVNNAQNPFVWERINIELGASCTFSTIPFDKGVMAIGNRGIVISDGNDTIRFDEKIPDDIFSIRQSSNGLKRVYGIRTFRTRLNYWTYPNVENPDGIFPDQVLVFNYETKNWSYFDDTFTCFGYFYPSQAQQGDRWVDLTEPWSFYKNQTSGIESIATGFETVIAGNQQGFVFKLEQTSAQNYPSLLIDSIAADALTSANHNLQTGTWVTLSNVSGTTSADGVSLNGRNFKIARIDANSFSLTEFESIEGGAASGASFTYNINFLPILSGSVQIDVGAIQFKDPGLDGILSTNPLSGNVGTLDYKTGALSLTFSPPLGAPTQVYIRIVSADPEQEIVPVNLTGVYVDGGLIAKISNIDIQTKIFNFFNDDQRSRLSKIDFYTDLTDAGQFSVNVFADSSNIAVNRPFPSNTQSNVVLTSKNIYQVGNGDQSLYRLFCDATAQTLQLQLFLEDRQMAVNRINSEAIEILSLIFSMRRGGRLL